MATFPHAFLLGTPVEIFANIALFLDASDLFALFLGGDVMLNDRLFRPGCVTQFRLVRDGQPLRFPSFAFLFPSLLELDLDLGYYTKCYGITKRTYSGLPKSLRKLKILMDSPGYVLVSPMAALVPKQPGTARQRHLDLTVIDLGKTFPCLEELVLRGSWSELEAISDLILPQSLTSLELDDARVISNAFIENLPTSLTRLVLERHAMKDETVAELQRELLSLQLGPSRELTPACIRLLPPKLESLSIAPAWVEASAFIDLPESLKSLNISSGLSPFAPDLGPPEQAVKLPSGLTALSLVHMRSTEDWIYPDSLLHLEFGPPYGASSSASLPLLPPFLRSLTLMGQASLSLTSTTKLPDSLTTIATRVLSIESPEAVTKLPRALKSLTMHQCMGWSSTHMMLLGDTCPDLVKLELPSSSSVMPDSTSAIPRNLARLVCTDINFLDPPQICHLPPALTLLEIYGGAWVDGQCLAQLPRTLTWLTIATNTSCLDNDFSHLPRNLKCLSIASTTILSDQCLVHLPPRLVSLKIKSATQFNETALALLPRTLVVLACGGGQHLSSQSILYLPSRLGSMNFTGNPVLTTEYFAYQAHRLSSRSKRPILHS